MRIPITICFKPDMTKEEIEEFIRDLVSLEGLPEEYKKYIKIEKVGGVE